MGGSGSSAKTDLTGEDVGGERAVFPPSDVPVAPPDHSNEKVPSRSSDKEQIDGQNKESGIETRVNDMALTITDKYLPVGEGNASRSNELSTSKSFCMKRNIYQGGCEAPITVQSGALYHGSNGERATCSDAELPAQSSITKKGSVPIFCNSSGQLHRRQDGPLEATTIVDVFYKKGQHKQVEFETVTTDCAKPKSNFQKSSGKRVVECFTRAKVYGVNLNNSFDIFGQNPQIFCVSEEDKGYAISYLSEDRHQTQKKEEKCHSQTANRARFLGQIVDEEPNDDSDTSSSSVDSMSGLDISPDDVVGVIGQKQFWKARKAIVNQQRVFAVQIFELHRLIKVQKLIAGAPNLLVDDQLDVRKSPKTTLATPFLSGRVIAAHPTVTEGRDGNHKPSKTIDCPSNNAAEKTRVQFEYGAASSGVASQISDYGLHSLNPSIPVGYDSSAGSWCFPAHGKQWLVPVMSPSEGLLYKPYAGTYPPPGAFMAPIYGGGNPVSLPPVAGDFTGAHYRAQGLHQQPGMGGFPSVPSYYPPYGYPVMNPMIPASTIEQGTPTTGHRGVHWQAGHFSGKDNCNMQSKDSCNMSNPKMEANLPGPKFPTSKDLGVQLSAAGSPSNRGYEGAVALKLQENGALPVFPMASTTERWEGNISSRNNDCHNNVIKVVPHNRRSASESAARIFQSIQEGRSNHDSH